jgi:hypothetical protein
MSIMIRDTNGNWIAAKDAEYTNESELQELLRASPNLLEETDDGSLVFASEVMLSATAWADLIGVRADGTLLIVETKLARNPEIRRKVIGQILEYASLLWKMDYQTLDEFFRREGAPSLYEQVQNRAQVSATINEFPLIEDFRRRVERNLEEGNFRLLIAVDSITDELERIVAYVACLGSGVKLEAIAVRKHTLGSHEALTLQRYGVAQPIKVSSSVSSGKLTIDEVLAKSEDASTRSKMEKLLACWDQEEDSVEPGTSGVSYRTAIDGKMIAFFWATPNEQWGIQPAFSNMEQKGLSKDLSQWLRNEIGKLPGFDLQRCLQMKYPSFKFSQVPIESISPFADLMHECARRWRNSRDSGLNENAVETVAI